MTEDNKTTLANLAITIAEKEAHIQRLTNRIAELTRQCDEQVTSAPDALAPLDYDQSDPFDNILDKHFGEPLKKEGIKFLTAYTINGELFFKRVYGNASNVYDALGVVKLMCEDVIQDLTAQQDLIEKDGLDAWKKRVDFH